MTPQDQEVPDLIPVVFLLFRRGEQFSLIRFSCWGVTRRLWEREDPGV